MSSAWPGLEIEALAEDALLLRFGETIDTTVNARVHAAAGLLRQRLPGVECTPAYASLLLRFEMPWNSHDDAPPLSRQRDAVLDALQAPGEGAAPTREVVIPVLYGGAAGPDLEAVASHAGLSIAQVIQRHAAASYQVAMLGFAPGFPYLLGLDPTLAMPRRADPRLSVPAGSVAIGGQQTGIYPQALPGGWQLIGRTPLMLFDLEASPPSRLQAGDRVRFEAIDEATYQRLASATGDAG